LPGLDDSKKLPPAKRELLASLAVEKAEAFGAGLAWQDEIDAVNILNADFRAMSRAVLALAAKLEEKGEEKKQGNLLLPELFIDGNQTIPPAQWQAAAAGIPATHLAFAQYFPQSPYRFPNFIPPLPRQYALVDGDALAPVISAASVLAKTLRDGIMLRLDTFYPGYGFARHKGYGTKEHLAAIAEKGPCPLHRMTFRGVRKDWPEIPAQPGNLFRFKPNRA
jgi:ribonuclease HII